MPPKNPLDAVSRIVAATASTRHPKPAANVAPETEPETNPEPDSEDMEDEEEEDLPETVRSLRDGGAGAERRPPEVLVVPLLPPWQRRLLSLLPWLVAIAFAILIAGLVGWVIGQVQQNRSGDPFAHYCGHSAATMSRDALARRNVVWRVWNGDDKKVDPEQPEAKIADGLATILHPEVPDFLRTVGAISLDDVKASYLPEEERAALIKIIGGANPVARAIALRQLFEADAKADELVREIMCDGPRISAFMSGEKVPLETLPDGSAP